MRDSILIYRALSVLGFFRGHSFSPSDGVAGVLAVLSFGPLSWLFFQGHSFRGRRPARAGVQPCRAAPPGPGLPASRSRLIRQPLRLRPGHLSRRSWPAVSPGPPSISSGGGRLSFRRHNVAIRGTDPARPEKPFWGPSVAPADPKGRPGRGVLISYGIRKRNRNLGIAAHFPLLFLV